jgi:hypothetical protein
MDRSVRHTARASGTEPDSESKRSPWVVGIIIGFVMMVLVNIAFITIAVKGADSVVPSYQTADR